MSFQLIDYHVTPLLEQLDNQLQEYLERHDFARAELLLTTPLDSQGYPWIMESQGRVFYLRPSEMCLCESIHSDMDHIYYKLLAAPYSIEPSANCLGYAALRNNTILFRQLVERYPDLAEDVDDQVCLTLAIGHANVQLVKFIVQRLRVTVRQDLLEHIVTKSLPEDRFDHKERIHRNALIRAFLRRQLDDQGAVIRRPVCHRNLMNVY